MFSAVPRRFETVETVVVKEDWLLPGVQGPVLVRVELVLLRGPAWGQYWLHPEKMALLRCNVCTGLCHHRMLAGVKVLAGDFP